MQPLLCHVCINKLPKYCEQYLGQYYRDFPIYWKIVVKETKQQYVVATHFKTVRTIETKFEEVTVLFCHRVDIV